MEVHPLLTQQREAFLYISRDPILSIKQLQELAHFRFISYPRIHNLYFQKGTGLSSEGNTLCAGFSSLLALFPQTEISIELLMVIN